MEDLGLKICDYSKEPALNTTITSYYILLRMTFENSNIYKLFETSTSQIYRNIVRAGPILKDPSPVKQDHIIIDLACSFCKVTFKLQANFDNNVPIISDVLLSLNSNEIKCPNCNRTHDISNLKTNIELQTKRKIV